MLQQHQGLASLSASVEQHSPQESDALASSNPVVVNRRGSSGVLHRAPMAHRCKHRAPRSYVADAHAGDESETAGSLAEKAAV